MSFTGHLKPEKFVVSIPEQDVSDLKQLIKLGRLPPHTFEGADSTYGITNDWMKQAKDYWQNDFDWYPFFCTAPLDVQLTACIVRRKHEARINQFSHYKVDLNDDDGTVVNMHFIAVLSDDPSAIPLVLVHGWPGYLFSRRVSLASRH